MNKETAKLYLPMVKAFSEGEIIQRLNNDEWLDVLTPTFNSLDVENYRIKPKQMEFYAIANDDKTEMLSGVYKTEKEANDYINDNGFKSYKNIVHLREIE
jgi:hypothetical protein